MHPVLFFTVHFNSGIFRSSDIYLLKQIPATLNEDMLAQQSNSQRQEKVGPDKAFRQEAQRLIDTDTMPADRGADEPSCDCASTSSSRRPLLLSHFDPLPFLLLYL